MTISSIQYLHRNRTHRVLLVVALFEKLNLALVLFRLRTRAEGPEVAPFAGLGINLARIQSILTCSEFANHRLFSFTGCQRVDRSTESSR